MIRKLARTFLWCLLLMSRTALAQSPINDTPVSQVKKTAHFTAKLVIWGPTTNDEKTLAIPLTGHLRGRMIFEAVPSDQKLELDRTKLLPPGTGWEVVKDETSSSENKARWQIDFEVSPNQVPAKVELAFSGLYLKREKDSNWTSLFWDPVPVVIEDVPATIQDYLPFEKLEQPKPPRRVGTSQGWMAIVAVMVTLLIVLVCMGRWLRSSQALPVSPEARAFAELDRLEATCREPDPNWSRLYEKLAMVPRRYLEDACSLPARQQTTVELIDQMSQEEAWNAEEREKLSMLLQQCDEVKYAARSSSVEEALRLVEQMRAWIEQAKH